MRSHPEAGGASSVPTRILSWFAVRPGEGRRVLLAFAYLFLVICSYLMIKTVRNALFIAEYGAMKLPYVMLGVAVLAGLFAAVYIRLSRHLTTWRLVFWSLLFFAANLVVFWWLAVGGHPWLYPILYMWAGVFGVIAPVQVWTLANELFTTREAKRVFGVVGAGGILGGFAGGVLSNRLAPVLGTPSLLLVVAVLLCLAAVVVHAVARRRGPRVPAPPGAPAPRTLRESFRVILSSSHLRLLAGLVFISALATTSVDFQFNVVAAAHVPERDALAAFLGAVYAGISVASFLVQIVFTSRLLAWFGVGFVILMLPLSLGISTLALLMTGTLWAGVFLKASDGSLKHSADRSGRELLYLPVSTRIKLHAKSTIDTVMDRLGDGAAGVLQIVLVGALGLGLRGSLAANLGLLAVWGFVAWKLRKEYVAELLRSIGRRRRPVFDPAALHDADARHALEKILASANEPEMIGALEWISREAIPVDERVLADCARSASSPRVRRAALDALLGRHGLELSGDMLEELGSEQHSTLVAMIDLLVEGDPERRRERMEALLATAGDSTRLSLVALTLRRLGPEFEPMARRVFDALLDRGARRDARKAAARALALLPRGSALHDRLDDLIGDDDPEVAGAAAEAAARVRRPESAPALLRALARPGVRVRARRALAALGPAAWKAAADALADGDMPEAVRRQVPGVLALAEPEAVTPALAGALEDPDPMVRRRCLEALLALRRARPGLQPVESGRLLVEVWRQAGRYRRLAGAAEALDGAPSPCDDPLRWLLDNLEEKREQAMKTIFDLLALLILPETMNRAWTALHAGDAREKANAVELLENVLPTALREELIPLAEAYPRLPGLPRRAPRNPDGAVRSLAEDGDPWLSACALFAARTRGQGGLEEIAARNSSSPHPALRQEASAYRASPAGGTGS